MHMIRKGQMSDDANRTPAAQFYSLITYAILLISLYSSSHRYRDTTLTIHHLLIVVATQSAGLSPLFCVTLQIEPEGPIDGCARVGLQDMMPDPLVDCLLERRRTRTRTAARRHQLRP